MRDFSIDIQSEKIYSPKTKDYFKEVVTSYYSESYRSAVVMLYSIVIADLVYKVEVLNELYEDEKATEILNSISELQHQNPNSPDWEAKLVELIYNKTNLLEPSDNLHLLTLQKHRHLCAHPVLNDHFDLYRPNKETVRAHIRNMLEGILTKPPFLSRKVINDILGDLSKIKRMIYSDEDLKKHLNTKFLEKVNAKVLNQIFRSLWKITFKTVNLDCDENRDINFRALMIVLTDNYDPLLEVISDEKDFYSDIHEQNIGLLIRLSNKFPSIFTNLNNNIQILTRSTVRSNADLDTFAVFLSENIAQHIEKVLAINWESSYENFYITTQSIIEVFSTALNEGKRDLAFEFLVEMFGRSGSYDTADYRFNHLIAPNIEGFNNKELKQIVKEINNNSQISDRRDAQSTNRLIKARIDELIEGFNFNAYPRFRV